MRFIVFLLTFSAGLRAVCTVPSPAYFVATNGNDAWSGTLAAPNAGATDGPFRSIAKAQATMQGATTKTAVIRSGTWAMAATWKLTPADNGQSWLRYPGENVVLEFSGAGGVDLNNGGAGGVKNVTFDGLTFQNMSTTAMILGGDDSITLRRNTFVNCNENCITAGHLTNSVFDSNTFSGQFPGSVSGPGSNGWYMIDMFYGPVNLQFTHNLFQNAQGGAVALGGFAGFSPSDNVIDRNIAKNVNTGNITDAGAFYMEDWSVAGTGNRITNNLVNGNGGTAYVTNQTKAFYLDEGASNVLVSGNVCTKCGQFAWQIHSGDHNSIVNNIFDLSSAGTKLGLYQSASQADAGMAGNLVQKNLVYWGSGSVPSSLYQTDMLTGDALASSAKNLYYTTNGASIPNGAVIVDSAPVYANPLFAGPGSGNYAMPATSPAFTQVGFTALATDQGPQPECGGPVTSGGFTGTKVITTCSINSSGTPSKCKNQTLTFTNGVLQ